LTGKYYEKLRSAVAIAAIHISTSWYTQQNIMSMHFIWLS